MGSDAHRHGSRRATGRRRLLLVAGGAIVAGTAACCGLAGLLTSGDSHEITFADSTYEAAGMAGERVLVAYASRFGSTGGVADAIGARLAASGVAVDVVPIGDVGDLSAYSAVVIGSAIHGGRWMPEATEFVQTHQTELRRVPTATFLTCMTLARDSEQNRRAASAFLDPVREMLAPVAEGLFAGAMWPANFSFPQSVGVAIFCLIMGGSGDHRDWDAIQAWADSSRPLLVAAR